MEEISAPSLSVRWARKMAEIAPEDWDALARPMAAPFFEWEWLNRLETSGSITVENGWQPLHLTVRSGSRLVAAAPLLRQKPQCRGVCVRPCLG